MPGMRSQFYFQLKHVCPGQLFASLVTLMPAYHKAPSAMPWMADAVLINE